MTFWDHLEDLRKSIFRMAAALVGVTVVLFFFKDFLFEDVINVYSKEKGVFINSFTVSENKTYIVKVTDDAGNSSYKYININNIDKGNPIVDTNTYADYSERIIVYGENGRVEKNPSTGRYEYSNDTIF